MADQAMSPAQIESYLKGANYPASKDNLLALARQRQAPDDVVRKIQSLPGDQFPSTKDVMRALGQTE